MKVPNKIRIGVSDYEIELIDGLIEDAGLYGKIDYTTEIIKVEKSLKVGRMREVIAHELAHGILDGAGYEKKHDEQLIRRIGNVLAMVLRDNDFSFMRDNTESSTEEGFKSIMGHTGASSNDPTGDPTIDKL